MDQEEQIVVFAAAALQARMAEYLKNATAPPSNKWHVLIPDGDRELMADLSWEDAKAMHKRHPRRLR